MMPQPNMAELAKAEYIKYDDSMDAPKRIGKPLLISVIIPTYNMARFVCEAIDSVIDQTYKNIELIIVDDGSTDKTHDIIMRRYEKEMNESKSRFAIIKKENGGTASALNEGIKQATGDYIKWLSADDILYPTAIQDMIWFGIEDHAAQAKNAIFYTDYDIVDEGGNQIGEFLEPKERESKDLAAKVDELFQKFYGNGSTSLIHKNVFTKCGLFDDGLPHSEDYEFWLRASAVFHIDLIHIPIKSLKYRRHPGQLTATIGGQLNDKIRAAIRQQMSELPA